MTEQTVINLNVPYRWFVDGYGCGEPVTREDAMRYASHLAELLLDAQDEEAVAVIYDVVDYGNQPTAGDYDLSELYDAAWDRMSSRSEEVA